MFYQFLFGFLKIVDRRLDVLSLEKCFTTSVFFVLGSKTGFFDSTPIRILNCQKKEEKLLQLFILFWLTVHLLIINHSLIHFFGLISLFVCFFSLLSFAVLISLRLFRRGSINYLDGFSFTSFPVHLHAVELVCWYSFRPAIRYRPLLVPVFSQTPFQPMRRIPALPVPSNAFDWLQRWRSSRSNSSTCSS